MTDRLKELIKYKALQIAPAELEDIILTHPGVADVGVVGVQAAEPDDGEVPRAFIVLKPNTKVPEEEIQELVKVIHTANQVQL